MFLASNCFLFARSLTLIKGFSTKCDSTFISSTIIISSGWVVCFDYYSFNFSFLASELTTGISRTIGISRRCELCNWSVPPFVSSWSDSLSLSEAYDYESSSLFMFLSSGSESESESLSSLLFVSSDYFLPIRASSLIRSFWFYFFLLTLST